MSAEEQAGANLDAIAGDPEADEPTRWFGRVWIPMTLLVLVIGGFLLLALTFHPSSQGTSAPPTTRPPSDPAMAVWIGQHRPAWNEMVSFSFANPPGSRNLALDLACQAAGPGFTCTASTELDAREFVAQQCAQLRSEVQRLPRIAPPPSARASSYLASGVASLLAGTSACHAWFAEKTAPLFVRAQNEIGRGLNKISDAVQIVQNLGGH